MLFFFTSFLVFTIINKIKSELIYPEINLVLIRGTVSKCEINITQSSNRTGFGLCLNDKYNYHCHFNNSVNSSSTDINSITNTTNGVEYDCSLINNDTNCYEVFTSASNINNVTLNCFQKHVNVSLSKTGSQLQSNDQCLYGVINHQNSTNESTILTCAVVAPVIVVTTKSGNNNTTKSGNNNTTQSGNNNTTQSGNNNTTKSGNNNTTKSGNNNTTKSGNNSTTKSGNNNTTQSVNNNTTKSSNNNTTQSYYKFHFLGVKISKNFVKTYGIAILVALIVVACLIACCCYGLCCLCCKRMNNKKNDPNQNQHHNRKMQQSSTGVNV